MVRRVEDGTRERAVQNITTRDEGRALGLTLRRVSKERLGGALVVTLGLAVSAKSMTYAIGTLGRMGPGFMPLALGILLTICGAGIIATARGELDERVQFNAEWRGWVCIGLGLAAFVVLARHLGLLPAALTLVFISALGDRQTKIKEAMLLAVAVAAAGVVIFWWALKIQLPLFSWA